jgi:hypothetical protein
MADSAQTSWSAELKEPIELVLKIIAVLIVLGVAVVHIHLGRASYFSTNVSRGVYVAASFWLLLPLVVAWLFLERAAMPFLARQILAGKRARMGWAMFFAGLLVVFAVTITLLFAPEMRYISRQQWFGRLIVLAIVGCLVVAIPMGITHGLKADHNLHSLRAAARDTPLMAMLFYGLLYVGAFEHYAYGAIPAELGGGRPLLVRIVADSAARATLAGAGVHFPKGANASGPVRLLVATDGTYVVQTDSLSNAIEVHAGLVSALIYEPHK